MTPLMKQYWDVKAAHPEKIVLFRMGDFFEMFHDDAIKAAPLLNIALTCRNKKAQDETPMCGVPHHSIAGPIAKLLNAGCKVAICEQIEDAKMAKGLVKRAVTRVLTPGMVYDLDTLAGEKNNYIVCFDENSLSAVDCSTGENFYYAISAREQALSLLTSLQPVEVVMLPNQTVDNLLRGYHLTQINDVQIAEYLKSAQVEAKDQTPKSLKILLGYAVAQQGTETADIFNHPERRYYSGTSVLSFSATRHLEIFTTYDGNSEKSLFAIMDRTQTSMGRRRLKAWLQFPLTDKSAIEHRLGKVEFWVKDAAKLKQVREQIQGLGDLERRLARVSQPNCNARDLVNLSSTLRQGLEVLSSLSGLWKLADGVQEAIYQHITLMDRTLVEEPELSVREGGIIRAGFSKELDELIDLSQNYQTKLNLFEEGEKKSTGINSLKIRYNQVFGFYIEITHTHKDKVPAHYLRKQTLANAERFTTNELTELEKSVLSSKGRRADLEYQIFSDLRASTLKKSLQFLSLAQILSEVDVVLSLAWLALENRYCRPTFSANGDLQLMRSRHPVVERQAQKNFVPNSLVLKSGQTLLLTGPNMAGKSTLMRQVALTAVMAQIGSYIPADAATLPIYDQILTRIGASDALSEGLSTFMVEMKECSEILNKMSVSSLVILDEVGRGTSTYDGMSLAQSILEHLLTQAQGQVLFATHYFELTDLAGRFTNLRNAHMSIAEQNGEIVFLHTLTHGAARKSYGIHVAKVAGLPAKVLKRAEAILKEQEAKVHGTKQMSFLQQLPNL